LASIRTRVPAFSAVSGYEAGRYALTGEGAAVEVVGTEVSEGYFDVTGVGPARGRAFSPEEFDPGQDGVAILSNAMWVGKFGAAPDIIGRTILLDGAPRTVVGVMPEGYRPVQPAWSIWLPQTADPTDFSDWAGTASTRVIGRLAPDATREQADAELAPIARELHQENPDVFTDAFVAAATATPLQQAAVGSFSRTLWVLFGAVTLVLLIACANVANMLLARGEARSHELAVRRSMGASAGRLVRQLLTESAVLAAVGGGLGWALAWLGTWAFRTHVPSAVPLGDRVDLNGSVLAFAVATTVLTVGLFGLWPAVRALGPDPREALHAGGRRGGRGGRRGMNRTLMAAEVALSLVLLTGAGLLVKSSWLLQRVDPGFDTAGLLTLRVNLPAGRYAEGQARLDYFNRLDERVSALPGVVRVGSMYHLPMNRGHMSTLFTVKDHPTPEGGPRPFAMMQWVTPGLAETLGARLVRGRLLEPSDREDAPRVMVINESLARQAFGDDDPVGGEIQVFGWYDATVVGVVADVRETGLTGTVPPEAILSYPQVADFTTAMYVVVRTDGDPGDLVEPVVAAISAIDRDVPITRVATMDEVLRSSVADSTLTTLVFVLFAAVALMLSVVGVYGVLSYTVSERTYEIGVRVAMGAGRGTVVREIVRGSLLPLGLGLVVGVGAAVALTRVMEGLLFEVRPQDPMVLVTATLSLLIAAMAAVVVPARRAASVDPVRCLDG
jgi:predicted permease